MTNPILRTRDIKTGVFLNGEERILQLRDDGYSIYAEFIQAPPNNLRGEEFLWAEYKHCDVPSISDYVLDIIFNETK